MSRPLLAQRELTCLLGVLSSLDGDLARSPGDVVHVGERVDNEQKVHAGHGDVVHHKRWQTVELERVQQGWWRGVTNGQLKCLSNVS